MDYPATQDTSAGCDSVDYLSTQDTPARGDSLDYPATRNTPVRGDSWDYRAIRVEKGRLPDFIAAAKADFMRGFNITIPHKQDIIPYLDEIDENARLCGAVNTVVIREGKLNGYNTDMDGLLMALREEGFEYTGSRITLLGTGGAAAGILLKATMEGAAKVQILGRRQAMAEKLKNRVLQTMAAAEKPDTAIESMTAIERPTTTAAIESMTAVERPATAIETIAAEKPVTVIEALEMTQENLTKAVSEADILINATPLGMKGASAFPDTDFLEAMPKGALVCDLVYNPPQTGLLKRAEALRLKGINGLAMLIHQALLADELFLDRKIDKRHMFDMLKSKLMNL
ncbi:shikimate dehydrogenase (NADP(+)) [Clostridia bacterium]|nr:shikimate dehydrogenase (NADP(+)) [Clostridia bacterium]